MDRWRDKFLVKEQEKLWTFYTFFFIYFAAALQSILGEYPIPDMKQA